MLKRNPFVALFVANLFHSMVAASGGSDGSAQGLKRVLEVHTKLDKNDKDVKKTVLTMDFSGCTMNDLISPAEDTLVIALQGRWRRAKSIPAQQLVPVKALIESLRSRAGGPETVESLAAKGATMSKEEREKLIAMLRAADKQAKTA